MSAAGREEETRYNLGRDGSESCDADADGDPVGRRRQTA
jgi:hypothetical protein